MISCIWAWACSTSSVGPSRLIQSSPSVNSMWTCIHEQKEREKKLVREPPLAYADSAVCHSPLNHFSDYVKFKLLFVPLLLTHIQHTQSIFFCHISGTGSQINLWSLASNLLHHHYPCPLSLPAVAVVWSVRCSALSCQWWSDAAKLERWPPPPSHFWPVHKHPHTHTKKKHHQQKQGFH